MVSRMVLPLARVRRVLELVAGTAQTMASPAVLPQVTVHVPVQVAVQVWAQVRVRVGLQVRVPVIA